MLMKLPVFPICEEECVCLSCAQVGDMIQQPSSSMCTSVFRSRRGAAERITGVLRLKGAEALPGWLGSSKKTILVAQPMYQLPATGLATQTFGSCSSVAPLKKRLHYGYLWTFGSSHGLEHECRPSCQLFCSNWWCCE